MNVTLNPLIPSRHKFQYSKLIETDNFSAQNPERNARTPAVFVNVLDFGFPRESNQQTFNP